MLTKIAGSSVGEQLGIGHARPEEVAEAAGQLVTESGRAAEPGSARSSAIGKVRRKEHAEDRVPDRIFVRKSVPGTQRLVKSEQIASLRRRERPAVGALGELLEGLEMARLGREPVFLDLADLTGNLGEVRLDGLQGFGLHAVLRALAR